MLRGEAAGVCYQPSTPQLPCVPHLLTPPPRQAGLPLHQAVSRPCLISRRLLSAHPSVDKWPAGWLLVTPAWRGPSSQSCVWQFGLEPTVGGLPVEEAQPSPASGASNPRTTPWLGHAVPRTHPRPGSPARPVPLCSLALAAGLLTWVRAGVVVPIERMGKLRLRERMRVVSGHTARQRHCWE